MDPLIAALLQAGTISQSVAEILNRQVGKEVTRQWADDTIFTATQSALTSQQERLLSFLLATEYNPTPADLARFWAGENESLGRLWLPTVRGVATEIAAQTAGRAGLVATFNQIDQAVLSWVDRYYASTDEAALGSLPNLNQTARTRVQEAFLRWQRGEFGGTGRGLPTLIQMLEPAFGPTRAEAIGITETTRIFTQAVREVESLNPYTVGFMWLTSDPCEICAPMHGQIRRKNGGYPTGVDIPAHPRCICEETPLTDILFDEERSRLTREGRYNP